MKKTMEFKLILIISGIILLLASFFFYSLPSQEINNDLKAFLLMLGFILLLVGTLI